MEILLDTLEDLTAKELKKFKLFLMEDTLEGFKRIPKGDLETTDPSDVTRKMREVYGDGSLKITLHILKKMGRNDLVQRIESKITQPSPSVAVPTKVPGESPKDWVFKIRPSLISGVNNGVLKDMLVHLQAQKVLNNREVEEILQRNQVLSDQVTSLVDMMLRKGNAACSIMLDLLKDLDGHLYRELHQ